MFFERKMTLYYFDTSIWLDVFEKRENFDLIQKLLDTIISNSDTILYSQVIIDELKMQGYSYQDVVLLFYPFKKILRYTDAGHNHLGKAKDLAEKRNLPKRDALHALITREEHALLITRDRHFLELKDICKCVLLKNVV